MLNGTEVYVALSNEIRSCIAPYAQDVAFRSASDVAHIVNGRERLLARLQKQGWFVQRKPLNGKGACATRFARSSRLDFHLLPLVSIRTTRFAQQQNIMSETLASLAKSGVYVFCHVGSEQQYRMWVQSTGAEYSKQYLACL